ncbi:MAG: tyrosine-type recombinase/integrase [Gammaproteobacteria bacterium]|nr:tyrosine-type recombinase/integrase [Gammaproteobacteria bacterium]
MPQMNFTKSALEAIKPADGKRERYQDHGGRDSVPGLTLKVTPTGAKTFYLYRRVSGRPEEIRLGAFPALTVEQARSKARVLNGEIEQGANPNEARRVLREEQTVGELFAEFIENKRNKTGRPLSPETIRAYRCEYEKHLAGLGKLKLSQVTPEHIEAIYRRQGKAHPISANRVRALAASLFEYARLAKRIAHNPVRDVPKLYAETKRERFIQRTEFPRFFQALGMEENTAFRDFFLLALLTGARRANVAAMRWDQLDLVAAEWRIPKTKNGEPQLVTLSPEAVALLTERRQGAAAPFVFPSKTSASGYIREPKSAWRRTLDRAELLGLIGALGNAKAWGDAERQAQLEKGLANLSATLAELRRQAEQAKIDPSQFQLADLRIHDLRRTLGSWQAKTGASMAVIGKSLNHKSIQSTAIYSRLDVDPVRQSVNTATAAMLEAAGVKAPAEVVKLDKRRRG